MVFINEITEALPHRRSIKKVKTYSEGKKQFAMLGMSVIIPSKTDISRPGMHRHEIIGIKDEGEPPYLRSIILKNREVHTAAFLFYPQK